MHQSEDKLLKSIGMLERWIDTHGWAGYDPYDLKGTRFFIYLQQAPSISGSPLLLLRRILFAVERRYPLLLRRLFRIEKTVNPKGIALLAKAYLTLYSISKDRAYHTKAEDCLVWLLNNTTNGYKGMSWSYPFDYQTKIFMPRGTPYAIVSSIVGEAFWTSYKLFGDDKNLRICDSICEFFLSELNIDRISQDMICFSYTPLDDFHLHNVNLYIAEFLVRVGYELGRDVYIEEGIKAANYALQEQNPDGSIFYWGKLQDQYNPSHVDPYHSGFEIRKLDELRRLTGNSRYQEAVVSYFDFYVQRLLHKEGNITFPKASPDRIFPVDIHSCAESILMTAQLASYLDSAWKLLPPLLEWTIANMQMEEGWFAYQFLQSGKHEKLVAIPYFRWGQAWMYLALCEARRVLSMAAGD